MKKRFNIILISGLLLTALVGCDDSTNKIEEENYSIIEKKEQADKIDYMKLTFEELLHEYFTHGTTTVEINARNWDSYNYNKMKLDAKFFKILINLSMPERVKFLQKYDTWVAVSKARVERDTHEGGTGAGGFNSSMMSARISIFEDCIDNMKVMDDILTFSVRFSGKENKIINGELDITVKNDEKISIVPFSQMDCKIATKKKIGKNMYHAAVFYPDNLTAHQMERGGCLILWENGKHVASFPWSEEYWAKELIIQDDKTILLVKQGENQKVPVVKFDFSTPNNWELKLDHYSLYKNYGEY